ncbi:MAG: hypothetical protein WCD02_10445 [Terriglobales bacterium]
METEIIPSEMEMPLDALADAPIDVDPLAKFRAQVAAEKVEPRGKASEAALARLRTLREQDKADAIVIERFSNALKSVIVNPENLGRLIQRCTVTPLAQLSRRAHKLAWFIEAGYELGREIDSVSLLMFLSALTPDETAMTDGRFAAEWDSKSALKVKASRLGRGLIESDTPVYRPCKSANKCLRFEKRKPALAKGSGEYCSTACAASAKARQKRGLAALPSDSTIH